MSFLSHKLLTLSKTKIEYVGRVTDGDISGSNVTLSLTSLTGGIDNSAKEGDIVIAISAIGSQVSTLKYPITSGYTALSGIYVSDTYDISLTVSYKVMGSTPDTSVQIEGSGSSSYSHLCGAYVFRNVDASSPIDTSPIEASGTNSCLINPSSITPTNEGSMIVAVGGASLSNSFLGSFTSSDLDNFYSSSLNSSYDCGFAFGSKAWEGGAFDPAQFGHAAGDDTTLAWASSIFALKVK